MRKLFRFAGLALLFGCEAPAISESSSTPTESPHTAASTEDTGRRQQTLIEARRNFATKVVRTGDPGGTPDRPPEDEFDLIQYDSPAGQLAAYITPDPGDGQKRPAIVWITGGDCNSIGDVWSAQERDNDQSASPFRKASIVMMFPSLRGGNDNPGKREGFLGEVDDILAATDHLASLPFVDAEQIYLGGHSTGGTMALLVAECSDRYRAIFALGPAAAATQYGGEFVYCDPSQEDEIRLRSPIYWMHSVTCPTFVFEGADGGNWDGAIEIMAKQNSNPRLQFFKVDGHNHFSVIAPLAEILADQIIAGQVNVTQQTVLGL